MAVVVMLIAAATASAEEPPRLLPMDRNFTLFAPYPELHAYKMALRDGLLGAAHGHSWEAVVIPSFEREWSLHLQATSAGGGQEVVCTIMREQLHARVEIAAERSNRANVPVDRRTILAAESKATWRFSSPISATAAGAIERLAAAMLARARMPIEHPRCIDGTSYYMFQAGRDTPTSGGMARCPQAGTANAAMLEIVLDLRKLAASSGADLVQRDAAVAHKAIRVLASLE